MKPFFLYNTLTRKKEPFQPQTAGRAGIYACGITLYDDIHIGHLRSIMVFDLLRNFLAHEGYQVTFVRNITDIDDKIIKKAAEKGVRPGDLVAENIGKFHDLLQQMEIPLDYTEPKVTEYMPQIQDYIQKLIQKDRAYVAKGNVYFIVPNQEAYPLSGKILKDLEDPEFARVEEETDKHKKADFALWKKDEVHGFPSPWGEGRPGWHIECSVMHYHTLGEQFDIHGGGSDLVFPHHENEILQSHAHNGCNPARYWMHNGMMKITAMAGERKVEQKISKSTGNSIYVKDLLPRYGAAALKYYLLKAQWSSTQIYKEEELAASRKFIERFEALAYNLGEKQDLGVEVGADIPEAFLEMLRDDLNTPKALAWLNQEMGSHKNPVGAQMATWLKALKLLMVYPAHATLASIHATHKLQQQNLQTMLQVQLDLRNSYRQQAAWDKADALRQELAHQGFFIMDLPDNGIFITTHQAVISPQQDTAPALKP